MRSTSRIMIARQPQQTPVEPRLRQVGGEVQRPFQRLRQRFLCIAFRLGSPQAVQQFDGVKFTAAQVAHTPLFLVQRPEAEQCHLQFRQIINHGWQQEFPDEWLSFGNPWELQRPEVVYQVPFGGREMPLPYGWGTGGIQVTAAIVGQDDTLKVIDQGADDTTNAVSIRRFFARVAGVATTTRTAEATIIQTRHRVPETPLKDGQILVFQVPIPEPLRMLEPRETETRTLHALSEYGVMQVSLYESIARHGRIAKTYNYPVMVNGRYIMSPSPIPKFDNPKLDRSPALQLYGAGREKRIYAVPPYTSVKSLDFEDHPFTVQKWEEPCALCGAGADRLWPTLTAD